MNFEKDLLDDLAVMKENGEQFFKKYEKLLASQLHKENISAEEGFERDILFDFLQHIKAFCDLVDYIRRDVSQEGTLSRDENGVIRIDGEEIPALTEFEILVRDEFLDQEVWTRVFVADREEPYVVGLKKGTDLNGLKARRRG